MAGVIGLRGPDIEKRAALRGYKVEWRDADRPMVRPHTGAPVLVWRDGPVVERHLFGLSRKFSSFNARADRLLDSSVWRPLLGKAGHHGVAPVSYFIEWAGKQPYRIERADGAAMAVPALVTRSWDDPQTPAFALVTVPPNSFVAHFHDRMVAQLADDAIDAWLRASGPGALGLLSPGPADDLVAVPLRPDVGGMRFDDAKALEATGPAVTPATVGSLRRAPRQATL